MKTIYKKLFDSFAHNVLVILFRANNWNVDAAAAILTAKSVEPEKKKKSPGTKQQKVCFKDSEYD